MRVFRTSLEIASAVSTDSDRVIAVDGFQASGKTTLGRALAGHLGIRLVSADDYLNRNKGAFFDHLRLGELAGALTSPEPCIFEGVCALQILDAVGVIADKLVYVKRMAVWGWADSDELEPDLDLSGSPLHTLSVTKGPADPIQVALSKLWAEVAGYHKRYRPHEVADIVYERSDAT